MRSRPFRSRLIGQEFTVAQSAITVLVVNQPTEALAARRRTRDGMGDRPLVSVCVPTFNAEPWIRTTVQSVLDQTHESLELVISDGRSTDATHAILGEIKDPRIRVELSSRRLPVIDNWNQSVVLATGEFLKFLHQDDTLVPTCIEEMLAVALEDPRVGTRLREERELLDDAADAADLAWVKRYGRLYSRFTELRTHQRRVLAAPPDDCCRPRRKTGSASLPPFWSPAARLQERASSTLGCGR